MTSEADRAVWERLGFLNALRAAERDAQDGMTAPERALLATWRALGLRYVGPADAQAALYTGADDAPWEA